ncbi:cysteine--tRNA ligase ['Camptotheca acuminata' phytoplasma]|uniref:cysteine--tRNA ligase n=1 Tax='Camptotheca acuminata' phytoplasma TaxID=3239192 RepID=UPI00351A6519
MLKIYNSLIDKKEKFYSVESKKVNMYVCGPTVYDHLHIGNIRPLIFFDLVKKYFSLSGFEAYLVVNITDIDDKIIKKALDSGSSERQISQQYIHYFFDLLSELEIKNIDKYPSVTQYMDQIISFIGKLIEKGYTYELPEGIYFKTDLISSYGSLSNQNLKKLQKNVRKTIDSQKQNTEDFVLWKKTEDGIKYESPWFYGRPGWHTECVTMIQEIFQNTIDIHGGGNDLKFPHHENEQSQFFAMNKKNISNFFMHVGRVDYQNDKMSKSLRNVVLAKDLLEKFGPNVIKLFFLYHNYMQPIEYSDKLMQNFKIKYDKIIYTLNKINFKLILNKINSQQKDSFYIQQFFSLMSNNFDTPNIFTMLEELLKKINKTLELHELAKLQNTFLYLLECLNIFVTLKDITSKHIEIYNSWEKAKQNRDFEESDFLRNILQKEQLI